MQTTTVQDWLAALDRQRRALKMPLIVLAKRAKVSRATICRMLKEKSASTSLQNVLAVARVLGAELGIQLQDPERIIEEQIQERAQRIARMVQGTMALEGQGITGPNHFDQLVQTAANEIRAKPRKHLWARHASLPAAPRRNAHH